MVKKQIEQTEINAPYELPEGWKWVRLGDYVKISTGKKDANFGSLTGKYPFFTCATEPIMCDSYSFDCDAILLAGNGDIGNISKYNGKFEAYQRTYVLESTEKLLKNFLYYLLKFNWVDYNRNKMFGSTIPYIRMGNLIDYILPLPTLTEQNRIVSRIESLFSKLDSAKEKAQSVVDSFENRKAAILHKAFTGELTKKWRAENGVGEDSWVEKKLEDCGKWERGRSKHRPRNAPELFGGKYPFIQTGDVANADVYINEHKQTLSKFGFEQSRLFPKGTLCITIAANIGKVAILTYDCCFPDSVVGFTPFEQIDSKFMYFKINEIQKDLDAMAPATAQKNLNLKLLTSVSINVPSLPEQNEIVRILDVVLEKENKAKEAAEAVLEQIELLKKSILARAFRGEL